MNEPRSSFTTDRPVAVLMVFLAAVVFGYFSFNMLPVMLMPELSYPTLTVRTEYPGAAPEEVENEISRPVEEQLGVVGGLNKISSISRAGISDVVLEFVWGTDMSKATQEALEKLDMVFLPQEAENPLILHFDPSLDPIMELSFSGEGDRYEGEVGLRRLRRIADIQIKRELEKIPGVAAVRVRGGLEEEYHVLLDAAALRGRKLSIQQVIDRLRQENINIAGGTLKEGGSEYMVRAINEYVDLSEIADTIVMRNGNQMVRVKDIARVVRSQKDREILTRTDGSESVQIDLYKEADANIVSVAQAVKDVIKEVNKDQASGPQNQQFGPGGGQPFGQQSGLAQKIWKEEGALLEVVADRSIFIKSSIDEVKNTAILGGLLAVVVLFLFLHDVKTTAIIAVSIPMSLLITFAPMNLMGVSLNIMSLGGLAMGVGMLVDSSIVVLESIFRCREEGDDLRGAAVRGTSEVRGAVIASTLTSICVFFPMVFVEGIAGQAFGDLGMAVVVSLIASLIVAVGFIPMLASRGKVRLNDLKSEGVVWKRFLALAAFKRSMAGSHWSKYPLLPYFVLRLVLGSVFELLGKLLLGVAFLVFSLIFRVIVPLVSKGGGSLLSIPVRLAAGVLDRANRVYPRAINGALRSPVSVILIAMVCCGLSFWAATQLDSELLPEVHQGEFTFEVRLPVGTPIEETERILSEVEQAILAEKDGIKTLLVTFGFDVTNIKRSDEGEHSARFKVLLEPSRDPVAAEDRVLARLRPLFSMPDVAQRVVRPVLFSSRTPIEVEIHGDDLEQLREYSQEAEKQLAALPEVADVESTLKRGAPEIQVVYNRDQIVRFGMNIEQIANQVKNLVKGFEATRFNMKDRRIPIVVRLEEEDRQRLEDIGEIVINPGATNAIPLRAVADLVVGEGPSEIRRVDGNRIALIEANLGEASLGGAVRKIQETLRSGVDWPQDMTFLITGQNEEWERSKGSLYLALGLSIFLVYVIMAAQFESLLQPFIIMFTIPLAFIGTIAGLVILDMSLSIVVFLGMIMLAGIVVNNAIVLVDYINTLQRRGMELREAITTAGGVRLRPILMTTATTVLGLLPMGLGLGDGAEIRTPMAIAVIGGLISSTVLTLFVIPTIYYLVERAKAALFKPSEEDESEMAGAETVK